MSHGRSPIGGALAGLSAGMIAMFLFDPDRGRSRRAYLGEQMRGTRRRLAEGSSATARDAVRRGRGIIANLRARLPRGDVSPRTLGERVRARMGRVVSNAGAIDVHADEDGTVTLSGPLLKREQNRLLVKVWSTPGVTRVENRLELHDEPGDEPGLQGARTGDGRVRDHWPASLRVAAGTAGAAAALAGIVFRPAGLVTTALGGTLLARAACNKSLRTLVGFGPAQSLHLDKQIFINAPPERVFACWRSPEEFPRFMHNVLEVKRTGADRWHWKIAGPAGATVEWDAELAAVDEGRRIAWRSVGGTSVRHEGFVEMIPEREGTRLKVSLDYMPAGGVAGHGVAKVLGKDAKQLIDADLVRLKSYLETGTPPHDAARSENEPSRPLH